MNLLGYYRTEVEALIHLTDWLKAEGHLAAVIGLLDHAKAEGWVALYEYYSLWTYATSYGYEPVAA